jgi:hypothetical protein
MLVLGAKLQNSKQSAKSFRGFGRLINESGFIFKSYRAPAPDPQ